MLQTNDVMRLSAETLKLARIAGIDYADAANYMTNAVRSFKMEMEDAGKVTDVYSALAASSAVSVSELAEAMSKTASSANSVGSSLENTSAMIAVMTEATRESASNIGSALKSIISRYGEMKASPKDILNIDGEEASFNKVDTALKSIGISLKDAQGQFRDFDDVIMELASVWGQLDNNTQRYIATIMAGNRQQSRFIALVSSYDRLKELTSIAAESEDAAQQQFLKTLDSIEAKTQQLQTSLQNLYTSAGLEELYKGLLDRGAIILNYYNNIATTFGNGITGALAAVSAFGAQFYNLANIIVKVLRLVKTHYINNQKQLDLIVSAHNKIRAKETLTAEEQAALESKNIYIKNEDLKTLYHAQSEKKRLQITRDIANAEASLRRRQNVGNTLYGIGTAASIAGTAMGGTAGTVVSMVGSGLGIAGGLMIPGGQLAALMSAISLISSIISLFESASKKINELKQSLTDLRNTETQSKSEQKNLETALKQEEALRKTRYKTAEDAEAYQQALNSLAEIAPSLIIGYTDAGDAILDVTRAEEVLAEARKKTRKATYEAAEKELELRETEYDNTANKSDSAVYSLAVHASQISRGAYLEGNYSPETLELLEQFPWTTTQETKKLSSGTIAALKAYQQTMSGVERLTEGDNTILKLINTILTAYPDVMDSLEVVDKASQALSAAYLSYNQAEKYKFIDGSSGLQILAANKINDEYLKSNLSWTEFIKIIPATFYESLEDFYTSLNEEQIALIDKIIANPQLYSAEDITRIFSDLDSGVSKLVTLYFKDYTTDGLNRLTAGLKTVKDSVGINKYIEFIKQQGYEFTNTEADFLIDAYQNASNLFNSSLTAQADAYYKAFFGNNITQVLQSLNAEEKDAFYSLWIEYGINTKAGIQSIIDELINNYNFDEDNLIITSLRNAQKALVENVALSIQATTDKFSESWKEDSENIVKLTEGIEFIDVTKTIARAERIGLELNYNDFVQNGDKFVLSAEKYNDYVRKYFEFQQQGTEDWANTVKTLGELVVDGELRDNIDYNKLAQNFVFLKEIGFDRSIENYFDDAGKLTQQGLTALQDLIKSAANNVELYNWLIQQANNNLAKQYIEAGNIRKALELLMPNANDTDIETEIQKLANGNYNEVSELVQPYISFFIDYFNNINKTVVDAFINSLNKKGAQTIDVNDDNREFLEFWGTNADWSNYVVFSADGTKATINFANATAQHLNEIRQQIIDGELKTSEESKESIIAAIDKELYTTRSPVEATKQILENYSGFSREVAKSFADALGENLDDLVGEYNLFNFDEVTGKYTTNLKQFFDNLYTISNVTENPEAMAEISDAVQDFFSSVADKIEDGLKGSLSAGGARELSDIARQFNIELDFSQTVDGLRMSNEAAIELWATLTEVDKIAAELVFKSLKEQLTKAGESCENIFKTLSKIETTTKSLNSGNVKNTNELKNQLALYKQIAKEQMFDEKSYDFMNFALPKGFESPLTYWSNVQDMKTVLKTAMDNQYITFKDYYNSITEAYELAQTTGYTYEILGQKITGDVATFNAAWEQATAAWATLEDGTNVVDLTKFGIDFKTDAKGMSDNFDVGFKTFAQEQVKMLDTIIPFFETIVTLQEGAESLEPIELNSLIELDGSEYSVIDGAQEKLNDVFKTLTQIQRDTLNQIKIDGKTGILDYLLGGEAFNNDNLQTTYDLIKGLKDLVNVKDWESGADLFKYADFGSVQTRLILTDEKGNPIQAFSEIVPKDDEDRVIKYSLEISTKEGDMGLSVDQLDKITNFIEAIDLGGELSGTIAVNDGATIDYSITIDSKTGAASITFGDYEAGWSAGNWTPETISTWLNSTAILYQQENGTGAITTPKLTAPEPIKLDDGRIISFTSTLTDESDSDNIKYALPTGTSTNDITLAESAWKTWVDQHHIDDGFAGFEVVATSNENGNPATYIKLQKDDGAELYYKLDANGEATQVYKTPLGEYTTKESAAKSWSLYIKDNDVGAWAKEQGFTQVGLRSQNDGTIEKERYIAGQGAHFDYIFTVDADEDVTYNGAELDEGETIEDKVTNWRDNLPTSDGILASIKEKFPNADYTINTEEENGAQKPKSITFGDGVEIDWTFPLSDKAGTSAAALDEEVGGLLQTIEDILARYNTAKGLAETGFSAIELPGELSISITDAGKYKVTGTGLVDGNNQPVESLTFDSLGDVQTWLTSLIPDETAFQITPPQEYKLYDTNEPIPIDGSLTYAIDQTVTLTDQNNNLIGTYSDPTEAAKALRNITATQEVAIQKAPKQFSISQGTFESFQQGKYSDVYTKWLEEQELYGENKGKNFITTALSFLALGNNNFDVWKEGKFKTSEDFDNWLNHFGLQAPEADTADFISHLYDSILTYLNEYMIVEIDHQGYSSNEAAETLQKQAEDASDKQQALDKVLDNIEQAKKLYESDSQEYTALAELSQIIEQEYSGNLERSLNYDNRPLVQILKQLFSGAQIDWTQDLENIDFSHLVDYAKVKNIILQNQAAFDNFGNSMAQLNIDSDSYSADIENLFEELRNAISEEDWELLSSDIGQGVLKELYSPKDSTDAAKTFATTIENALRSKNAFDTGSPSKRMIPLGLDIAKGIGVGIQSGNLSPYIQTLVEKALGVKAGSLGGFKAINKGTANTNRRDSTQELIDETAKGNSSIVSAVEAIQKSVKLPTLQELRQALDGIATHTDFLINGNEGTGVTANNFVLATEAGNQHYNVQMDNNGVTLVPAERNTTGYHDTIVIPFESDTTELDATVTELENKQIGIPVEATNLAAFKNQILAYIRAIAGTQIGMDIYVQSVTANGVTSNSTANSVTAGVNKTIAKFGQAKGNVALSKGTLMGELGPELYVTGGHYYIAGEKGAEFVDLPDDAIVFNHLQTKRLMKTGSAGRGDAVTNEKKATSFATGNVAMASASTILEKLKELRDMWSSLASTTPQSLATKGGSGGGGGKDEAINLHDLDRWYNLMRQIEKIEEQITYQQKLRENMRNGGDYVKSLEYELALLEKEQYNYQLLSELQKSYYEARRKDQEESIYGKIFTYDEDGLMQYVDGAFRDVLAKMEEQRTTGVMKYTNAQQKKILTNYLLAQGVSQQQINDTLNIKTDGTKVENDEEWIENFWDKFDGWIEEMDSMYDSYTEYQTKVQEMLTEQNKILEEYRDLQLSLEQQLLKAIEDREQAVIDKLQDTYDAINDASQKYIDGLSDTLAREQDMYRQNQDDQELTQLQRRLAILQRSGGSGSEILALQKQIDAQMQDRYFTEQQNQIDAIKEASDAQLEKLQQQIDIAQETLEYQKENGLFWAEVTAMMQNWTPEQMNDFVARYTAELSEKSALDRETTLKQTLMDFEKWYEHNNRFGAFNEWYDNTMTKDVLKNEYGVNVNNKTELERTRAIAKEAYQRYYADEDFAKNYNSAEEAAIAALTAEKNRRASMPVDYTQGAGSSGTTNSGSGSGSGPGSGKSYLNISYVTTCTTGDLKGQSPVGVSPKGPAKLEVGKTGNIDWGANAKFAQAGFSISNTKLCSISGTTIKALGAGSVTVTLKYWDRSHGYTYTENGRTHTVDGFDKKANAEKAAKNAGITKFTTFDEGGMVEKTGLVLAHAKEGVLKPDQVEQLRQLTLTSSRDSLAYQLAELNSLIDIVAPVLEAGANNSINIENATVEMHVDSISNDYGAQRAGEQALEAMLKIARKTSVQSIRR